MFSFPFDLLVDTCKSFSRWRMHTMDGVILSLLFALVLSVKSELSSSDHSLLAGNLSGLVESSAQSRTLWSTNLITHQITDRNDAIGKSKKQKKKLKKKKKIVFNPDEMIILSDTPTPVIDRPFSGNGSIPDDGCGQISVRFDDGKCYPLMRPCSNPKEWVTIDPYTLKGRCTPRLCGRDRVFVVRTGLCHDIYDTSECQGGRRLYYSPFGDPVCDCPIGHYPFPYPRSNCYQLFTQGPCPYGQVLIISDNNLACRKSLCPVQPPSIYAGKINSSVSIQIEEKFDKPTVLTDMDRSSKLIPNLFFPLTPPPPPPNNRPMVPTNYGKCYELGTSDHCSRYDDSLLMGFDIMKNELECVDISDPSSPYFSSDYENELIDSLFPQLYPEYDPIYLVYHGPDVIDHENVVHHGKKKKKTHFKRRQSGRTISAPLNPACGTGSGNGKCVNKIVPQTQNRETKPAVKPAVATNCSGSQRFDASTGRCENRAG